MPVAQRILTMLEHTPGPVTYQAIDYMIWLRHGLIPPIEVRKYISHIRRATGHVIIAYPRVGYALARNT
jgi:hypothetical protein